MNVSDDRETKRCTFDKIAEGECFLSVFEALYMRIEYIEDAKGRPFNAVVLESGGELEYFKPTEEVEPVKVNASIYE